MTKVAVADSQGVRGYVVRTDPPEGTSIVDTDRGEEWALVSALMVAGTVPLVHALWYDESAITGSPAIVWELHGGRTLHAIALASDPGEHLGLSPQLADLAVAVHSVDTSILPQHLQTSESWDDYIERRIQEWETIEATLRFSDPVMRLIAAWLRANKPAAAPLGLVHGDLNTNNVMVDTAGRYSLIDWELAHVGDPREDLGWLELLGINQPPYIMAEDPEQFYARYRKLMGLTREQLNPATLAYFTVLGSSSVFLQVVQRLGALARGEDRNINIAYTSCAVAGMHNVFLGAIDKHRAASKELA